MFTLLGGFGFFGGPPPPRRFCRPGPPMRLLGRPGFMYHHPFVASAMFLTARPPQPRHLYYLHRNTTTCVSQAPSSTNNLKYYTVNIPQDVYPGEIFRVTIGVEEYLVTCPEINGPGEQIVIGVETIPTAAVAVATTTPVIGTATIVSSHNNNNNNHHNISTTTTTIQGTTTIVSAPPEIVSTTTNAPVIIGEAVIVPTATLIK
jgi:hypothetical protein